jgi:hypothetical protein
MSDPASPAPAPDRATDRTADGTSDRGLILHQLYVACGLILAGAAFGLVGTRVADPTTGATVGTAVIGAGAALLPAGAAATRRADAGTSG